MKKKITHPKKRAIFLLHIFYKNKSLSFWTQVSNFLKQIKIIEKINIFQIYWTIFGNMFGPYQYAKISLIKSGW